MLRRTRLGGAWRECGPRGGVRISRTLSSRADLLAVRQALNVAEVVNGVCVYYCRTFYKAVRVGEEESGGHVL